MQEKVNEAGTSAPNLEFIRDRLIDIKRRLEKARDEVDRGDNEPIVVSELLASGLDDIMAAVRCLGIEPLTRSETIADLNDWLRWEPQNYEHLGIHVHTQGIAELDLVDQCCIGQAVSRYDDFTPENDPHGERDYGSFEYEGKTIIWKIDYYDKSLTGHSPDPSDWHVTTRVLTTMLASEY